MGNICCKDDNHQSNKTNKKQYYFTSKMHKTVSLSNLQNLPIKNISFGSNLNLSSYKYGLAHYHDGKIELKNMLDHPIRIQIILKNKKLGIFDFMLGKNTHVPLVSSNQINKIIAYLGNTIVIIKHIEKEIIFGLKNNMLSCTCIHYCIKRN